MREPTTVGDTPTARIKSSNGSSVRFSDGSCVVRFVPPRYIADLAQNQFDSTFARGAIWFGSHFFHDPRLPLWLPTAVIVVLTGAGSAAQSAQNQRDQESSPKGERRTAGTRAGAGGGTERSARRTGGNEANAPSLPMIGGIVSVGLNVEASRLFGPLGSTFIPPDTTGAVGPNHIVEFINGNFEVLDKTTGASIENRTLLNFWVTKVGVPAPNNNNIFDPEDLLRSVERALVRDFRRRRDRCR